MFCLLGWHDWKYSENGGTSGNWMHSVRDCQRCGKHKFIGRRRRMVAEWGVPVMSERRIQQIINAAKP